MRPSIASIEYPFERLPYHKASTFCSNMSKNAQAECKAKTCFQTLLRRSRFSRRSLKDRNERQDIVFPSIHRRGFISVLEPLGI